MKIQYTSNLEINTNKMKIEYQRKGLSNLNFFTGCLYFKLLSVLFSIGLTYLKFKYLLIIKEKTKLKKILQI